MGDAENPPRGSPGSLREPAAACGPGARRGLTNRRSSPHHAGFRTRNKTKNGKKINKARRAKGRANIAPASKGSGKHR